MVTISTSPEKTVACGVTISSFSVSAMASALRHFLDAALHVEVPFRHVVVLALEDLLEAAHRVLDLDLPSLAPGEDRGGAEGLAQEALDLARARHRQLVVGR